MNNAPSVEQCDTDALARKLEIAGGQILEMASLLEGMGTKTARNEALKLRMIASRIAPILNGNDHE